ncbi:NADP-dependent phosphogluconate dehydrogenase [Palleronia abyssalis]|uniref:6-phosphogluconate dehydrogenase, decarboxylating n=1 Tax=Palleronia abyssalis TaxID=1501240 RepID=A0A2R8C1W7_9RHOB|nr:NADP-dependent phosphogluconate dehydrogenase [Palleronia abyssalis]SPJ26415.1 6-phosphogluconate dehydrogenase, NADP(+)-dependent, decarboxylating [Palleronia abyssalis]
MSKSEVGLIGLGTMGAALALNIAEKGHAISVWNRTGSKTTAFADSAPDSFADRITPTQTLEDLVASLASPRAIILMVPAGDAVDQQIEALVPLLDPEDAIIDAGNANFRDTNRRMRDLTQPFLGIGVSGGEDGARHGPSIMGGGPRKTWDRVATILKDIAAKHDGEPCAEWLGDEGAGHFVKAVHNGIEYADMQLIAEAYGLMRDGLGMGPGDIADAFTRWNEGPLQSYLIEISAKVARATDVETGRPLLEIIEDAAGQKGTGRWTAIEAQHLAAPVPVIEAAVAARNMSARKAQRIELEQIFGRAPNSIPQGALSLDTIEQALICGKILCYSQGFDMLAAASQEFSWSLDLPAIARVWREGCIIRSAMLDDMAEALSKAPNHSLIASPFFADHMRRTHDSLRNMVSTAVRSGAPVPAHAAALAAFDTQRTTRGTANMIQGQRDFFGLHGFARTDDGRSDQHGPWGNT